MVVQFGGMVRLLVLMLPELHLLLAAWSPATGLLGWIAWPSGLCWVVALRSAASGWAANGLSAAGRNSGPGGLNTNASPGRCRTAAAVAPSPDQHAGSRRLMPAPQLAKMVP